MPRTAIPVVDVNTRSGVVIGATSTSPTEVNGDNANGHSISGNNGRVILHARNSTTGTTTLTILPGLTIAGFTMPSRTVSRVNAGDLLIGPFPVSSFGETVNIDVNSANWRLRAYRIAGTPALGAAPPVSGSAGSRVNVPLTQITRAGIDITAGVSEVTGSTNLHYFANDGNVVLLARTTSGDLSFNPVAAFTLDGQAVSDYAATVLAAAPVELAGPYPPNIYNQADGNVYLNGTTTALRLRAFWLPFQE